MLSKDEIEAFADDAQDTCSVAFEQSGSRPNLASSQYMAASMTHAQAMWMRQMRHCFWPFR